MIEFLAANWLWIVLIGAMVLMHRGGGCGSHGSHGGHGGHAGHGNRGSQRERSTTGEPGGTAEVIDRVSTKPAGDAGTPGHRHAA
jgi:hypothetical protein